MVVGAFFSIERERLLEASDERLGLIGWGCEDSLIGARSLALGNAVVPVYSAVGWHVWHPRRDPAENAQFRRNLALGLHPQNPEALRLSQELADQDGSERGKSEGTSRAESKSLL